MDTVSRQWVRIETGEGVQLMCRATMGDEVWYNYLSGVVEFFFTTVICVININS